MLFTAFYERGNMLGSDKKTAQIQGIMHNKEVQAASWPPLKSLASSEFVPELDKGWGGRPRRATGRLTARGRSTHDPRFPGHPPSLPASAPPAARGRRRLFSAGFASPERRRGRAAEAGLPAAMDRFVWTSGLLEINETLVIQQRGVRIYDGEEKVEAASGTGARSGQPEGPPPGCRVRTPRRLGGRAQGAAGTADGLAGCLLLGPGSGAVTAGRAGPVPPLSGSLAGVPRRAGCGRRACGLPQPAAGSAPQGFLRSVSGSHWSPFRPPPLFFFPEMT